MSVKLPSWPICFLSRFYCHPLRFLQLQSLNKSSFFTMHLHLITSAFESFEQLLKKERQM